MKILLHNHSDYPDPKPSVDRADRIQASVESQRAAGAEVVTDGELAAAGWGWNFLSACDGIAVGDSIERLGIRMSRAVVSTRIRYRGGPVAESLRAMGPADPHRKIVLPGPYALSRLLEDPGRAYSTRESLAFDITQQLALAVTEAVTNGATYIQIEEPGVGHVDSDYRLLRRLWEVLAAARGTAVLIMESGRVADEDPIEGTYAQLNTVAADALAIDVSTSASLRSTIAATGAGIPLLLGICDGGRREIEAADRMAGELIAMLSHYPFAHLGLQPSCGLAGLGADLASQKLSLLSQVRSLVMGVADPLSYAKGRGA